MNDLNFIIHFYSYTFVFVMILYAITSCVVSDFAENQNHDYKTKDKCKSQ